MVLNASAWEEDVATGDLEFPPVRRLACWPATTVNEPRGAAPYEISLAGVAVVAAGVGSDGAAATTGAAVSMPSAGVLSMPGAVSLGSTSDVSVEKICGFCTLWFQHATLPSNVSMAAAR